ncbi:MAG TPA: GNAT family N-acetyltransferase [Kofleriaceae bacterium]|nr:GNAT family N-acetyltransferase [Kofleriaceae bacterium]
MSARAIRCVEIEPADWPAIEALFGENGACAGCWCMWWRVPRGGALWQATRGAPARRAFRGLVRRGEARGVLASAGDEPVGWCAFGPRGDFPRVERVRGLAGAGDDGVWSVNCFYIARAWRGRGVARALLREALRACKRHGAAVVEGYPPWPTPGERTPSSATWSGPFSIFEELGFRPVREREASKALVRLRLRRK